MKNFFIYAALCSSLIASCQNSNKKPQTEKETSDNESSQETKKVSKRDYSITKANSYSDLFLDSSAMESFFRQKKLPDTLTRRIRSFYNTRNYQYAWFTSAGLTEQAFAFWNLHDYVTTYDVDSSLKDRSLKKRMDNLISEDKVSVRESDRSFSNTELTLTQHFIMYVLHNYAKGYVKRKEMERFIPVKKEGILEAADSLLNKKHKDNKYFEEVNQPYKLLKDQLAKYYEIAKKGGWPQIPAEKKALKKGMSQPVIAIIKKRLEISGDIPGNDTSQRFNDTLENGIRSFQETMGLTADGKISPALLKDLNVPVEKRIEQILINMGRMRWMTTEPSGQLIVVNIPEFELHVYEGKKKAFDMDVVVGKEGHNTTIFTGNLNQVVFSPYWNVPPSIVKKEILPALDKNPNYLQEHNMEQTGTEDGLPVIRQKPGPDNSLGRVKFLFPNSFNIYFHDTNAKSLFSKDKRAFSHGCIRLAEPEKMAQYLLRSNPEWTSDKIEEAMNRDQPQYVKLNKPVPVLVTYYTAWVDDNGKLNFRDDIYSHDKDLSSKMFTEGL
jgi:murein L,D-transpeptidase YcbB/YkuD